MTIAEGGGKRAVTRKFQDVYIPALKANFMVWPAVQILNFRVMPIQFQIVSCNHVNTMIRDANASVALCLYYWYRLDSLSVSSQLVRGGWWWESPWAELERPPSVDSLGIFFLYLEWWDDLNFRFWHEDRNLHLPLLSLLANRRPAWLNKILDEIVHAWRSWVTSDKDPMNGFARVLIPLMLVTLGTPKSKTSQVPRAVHTFLGWMFQAKDQPSFNYILVLFMQDCASSCTLRATRKSLKPVWVYGWIVKH